MTSEDALSEEMRDRLQQVLVASAFRQLLGAELASWGAGGAVVTVVPTGAHTNLAGAVHGGLLAAHVDCAVEVACNSWGRQVVATGLALHLASAAVVGEPLVATAREVTRSRRVASYDVVVVQAGRTVAWAQATAFRTDGWHLGEAAWPQEWRAAH